MQVEEYDRMFALEDRYWWFVGRRTLALGLLRAAVGERRATGDEKRTQVLDLGCGTGVIATELARWAAPIGLDMSEHALAYSRRRGLTKLVQGRAERMPLANGSVDSVLALDVFEHVEDDATAFREAFRVLRPGGVLVLTVPAFRALWGPHDVALMHFRRYTRGQVDTALGKAGFEVLRSSYSVFFLFPIVVLVRALEKLKRGKAEASLPSVPGWLNRALIRLQVWEAALIPRVRLPWGSSVVAVARKPGDNRL